MGRQGSEGRRGLGSGAECLRGLGKLKLRSAMRFDYRAMFGCEAKEVVAYVCAERQLTLVLKNDCHGAWSYHPVLFERALQTPLSVLVKVGSQSILVNFCANFLLFRSMALIIN